MIENRTSKADGISHAAHDLDAPIAEFGERLEKLITGIATQQKGSWHADFGY
jgi:hypothetical protein